MCATLALVGTTLGVCALMKAGDLTQLQWLTLSREKKRKKTNKEGACFLSPVKIGVTENRGVDGHILVIIVALPSSLCALVNPIVYIHLCCNPLHLFINKYLVIDLI